MVQARVINLGILLSMILSAQVYALEIPINDGFVTDTIALLSDEQQESLETILLDYQKTTSNEIAVVIVQSLDGEDISEAGVEVFREWGIGDSEKDNGILILLAYEDREVGITTGYGLEGAVPDLVAYGIIQKDMLPAFKNGQFYEGFIAGIASLEKHIGGEYTAERYDEEEAGFSLFPWLIFLFFIGFDFLAALFARTKSWWLGGVAGGVFGVILTVLFSWWISIPALVLLGLLFDYIVSQTGYKRKRGGKGGWGGGGGSWGGGTGGSGGGFGGFSGGSTGGGGAHGRW